MNLSTVRKYTKKHSVVAGLLLKNPVVVLGLDLPFVIATSTSLRNAEAMSIMLLCIHMFTLLAARFTAGRMHRWLRMLCHIFVSTIMMVLTRALVVRMFHQDILNSLGMYIYLMGVNGMTIYQALAVKRKTPLLQVLAAAFQNVLGFVLVMFLLSFVRELLGNGTLWGVVIPLPAVFPGLLIPFSGFISVGFLLAFGRFLNKRVTAFLITESARTDLRYAQLRGENRDD